jgi:hypothetical protein
LFVLMASFITLAELFVAASKKMVMLVDGV